MTVEEFNKRLSSFEKGVVTEIYKAIVAKKTGLDIEATVNDRVVQSGISASGSKFKPYSRKPLWVTRSNFIVNPKAAYQKGKESASKWATVKISGKNVKFMQLSGGYAELRRLQGLQIAYKDFSVRGEVGGGMWSNFGMTSNNMTKDGFKIIYKGKTSEAQDIIDAQSKREGQSIIALTKGEIQNISDRVSKIIDKDLKKNKI